MQQARDRRASQQQQAELKKLQKAKQAEIKKAARDCKLQLQAARRVKRERRQEEKREEDAAKLAKKQHQELINNTKKFIQWSQNGKRKASKAHKPATKRQKRVRGGTASVGAQVVAQPVPPQTTKTRPTRRPKKDLD
jgi:hypothetical protein